MKNLVNNIIESMEKNEYKFKVKNTWEDTISLVLIGEEGEEVYTIDFNFALEKVYIFETWRNNIDLIYNYDFNDFMAVTSFIKDFYN